jgi:hypothetical protein
MPELLVGATEPLRTMLSDFISTPGGSGLASPEDFLRTGLTVESPSTGIQELQDKASELLAHAVTKEDFEGVRGMMATNSELQVQLANARAEKDIVLGRIASAESERDQLRVKVDEMQVVMPPSDGRGCGADAHDRTRGGVVSVIDPPEDIRREI